MGTDQVAEFTSANPYGNVEPRAIPTDGAASTAYVQAQWYLTGSAKGAKTLSIDVQDVWRDVAGKGVSIGIVDDGFDVTHPDLAGRFDLSRSYDPRDIGVSNIRPDSATASHGTYVAGIIGAAGLDGVGTTGIAYEAQLVGFVTRFGVSTSARAELTDLLSRQNTVDVSNNSWGFTTAFMDNFADKSWAPAGAALESSAATGRNALGTVLVFAAGNDREYVSGDPLKDGDNTNYHGFSNNRHVITVGSVSAEGQVSAFSTPGASVFVAAPGEGVYTTRMDDGDGRRANDYLPFSGTSAAAPIVSGVVALMLEANSALGYRDVQDIIALSSNRADLSVAGMSQNHATTWNGGGLLVSSDVGFGLIDAHAAVRIAETWEGRQTSANEATKTAAGSLPASTTLSSAVSVTFDVAADGPFALQWAEVDVNIAHDHVGDLVIDLVSPSGTVSRLVDRPGAGSNARDNLVFTLTSNQFWSEEAAGSWQLLVRDEGNGGTGRVVSASLRLTGTATADDVFAFTDDFARLGSDPVLIADRDGGRDVINAAAIRTDSEIDLGRGTATIAGRIVTIDGSSTIEDAIGGDGRDILRGNEGPNHLTGGRGDDVLSGAGGDDRLDGGEGHDVAVYSGPRSAYAIGLDAVSGHYVVLDLRANGDGRDILSGIEAVDFADVLVELSPAVASSLEAISTVGNAARPQANAAIPSLALTSAGDDVIEGQETNDAWIDGGAGNDVISGRGGDDVFTGGDGNDTLDGGNGRDMILGGAGDDVILGGAGDDLWLNGEEGDDTIDGGAGDDIIGGGAGADVLAGGDGNDLLVGGAGDDTLSGGAGDDMWLSGEAGNDRVEGGEGRDLLSGGEGRDLLFGGAGSDAIWGDAGDDLIEGGDGDDVWLSGGDGQDTLDGGAGHDILVGGGGNDRLDGGEGYDFFVFYDDAFAHDTIVNFQPGSGSVDMIVLAASLAHDWNALASHMSQTEAGVQLLFDGDRSILIAGVTQGQLSVDDFRFF